VNGDVSTPRRGWWMILLYFAGAAFAGIILGLTAVVVAWLFGWF
jgi:hypothetical protein